MSQLIEDTQGQGFRGKADRRFTQALVVGIDPVLHICTLDVGATDAQGAPVLMRDVPFQPQTPPHAGDTVSLIYSNVSPHSVMVAGGQLGGQNSQGSLQVVGAVSSLSKSGAAKLKGDVTLTGAGGIALNQVGQNIEIDGSGISGVGVAVEVSGGTETAREGVLNFIPGANMSSVVAAVNGSDIDITLNAATQSGLGVAVEVSGGTETAVEGVLNFIPGANMTSIVAAQNGSDIDITLNAAGGGGVTSFAKSGATPLTGAVTISGSGGITLTESGNNVDIQQAPGSSNVTVEDGSGATIGVEPILQFVALPGGVLQVVDDALHNRVVVSFGSDVARPVKVISTTTYTLILSDMGKRLWCTNASGCTVTVPLHASVAFIDGAIVEIIQGSAVFRVTVAWAGGVSVLSKGNLWNTNGQYSLVELHQSNTFDTWFMTGDTS